MMEHLGPSSAQVCLWEGLGKRRRGEGSEGEVREGGDAKLVCGVHVETLNVTSEY